MKYLNVYFINHETSLLKTKLLFKVFNMNIISFHKIDGDFQGSKTRRKFEENSEPQLR